MMDHEHSVTGPSHVELDAVYPDANRLTKGLQGVFSLTQVRSTMREDLSHRTSLPLDQARPK